MRQSDTPGVFIDERGNTGPPMETVWVFVSRVMEMVESIGGL